ncbi:NAD(P)/FAD-dependent oxidoreductase [Oceanibacterium hippocampi]|uniref:4-methylaminobutanoate oxidase (Formaldehyde-forming) n=1 Tax=Oceanibacterium hippocampi TaxID=745714 RepID=A0A1Y5RVP7_9PROT|nr:FAD-binding oxidoreductase [Oceanibacterium hippocampi]SLN26625.1 4-methylaminobutanoate oxidase (formaldehyde-forming) [Oceanibacterium hippocampi]
MEAADIVIVGGGVIGSAVAYFLKGPARFPGRVTVVERDASYSEGSTARSAGSIRQQFSTPENIRMSQFGHAFLGSLQEHLGVDGDPVDIGFHAAGYLFLATPAGLPVLAANHAIQTAEGAEIALLDTAALAARYPWLALDDLAAGTLGLAGEGWFDGYGLGQAFRRKARSLGVDYRHDRVVGLDRDGARITAARLESGGRLACGALVDAAGPRGAEIAAMAGLSLPVRPRKRFVFVFDCRAAADGRFADCPLVIDPSGVYFRPEGPQFITGLSPGVDDPDPDCLDLEVDHDWFDERIWPVLAARVPDFEAIKMIRAWAGHYAYNTLDQNAVLGPHPEIGNFYFANGFSGHGLQQSPAVGRAIAELIVEGGYRSLDLSRFGYERIVANEPVLEKNVV